MRSRGSSVSPSGEASSTSRGTAGAVHAPVEPVDRTEETLVSRRPVVESDGHPPRGDGTPRVLDSETVVSPNSHPRRGGEMPHAGETETEVEVDSRPSGRAGLPHSGERRESARPDVECSSHPRGEDSPRHVSRRGKAPPPC